MIIRLVSPAPQPTILFCVTFKDLPRDLPPPPGWVSQLQQLARDDIPFPKSFQALDKSIGLVTLLDEIVFEISTSGSMVSCKFVDGAIDEWPLQSQSFSDAIRSILDDVYEAAAADERVQAKDRNGEADKSLGNRRVRLGSPPPVKSAKHVKRKSIFMTIVSSMINLTSSASNISGTRSITSPPTSPVMVASSYTPSPFRRRARSTIVDTFRRYVLSELSQRFHPGGYYTWVLYSMHRSVMEDMDKIVHQVQDVPSDLYRILEQDLWNFANTVLLDYSDSGNEDDDASEDTLSDESSIHTPSTSHFANQCNTLLATNPDELECEASINEIFRPEPSELLSRYYSPAELDEYRALSQTRDKLTHLITMEKQNTKYSMLDQKQHYDILEVRSRRRAWLNKSLAGSGVTNYGLATPTKSSRLSRASWSCEDYEYTPDFLNKYDDHQPIETKRVTPLPKRTRVANNGTLFPVSEENEDEVAAGYNDDLLQKEFEFDLEGGMRCPDADDDGEQRIRIALDIERSRNHPRIRTSSMYKPPSNVQGSDLSRHSPTLPLTKPAFSQTCSLQNPTQPVQPVSEGTPIYAHVEVNIGDLEISGYGDFGQLGSSEDEFTLAMDLPVKMRSQKRIKQPVDSGTAEPAPHGKESKPIASKLKSAVLTCR